MISWVTTKQVIAEGQVHDAEQVGPQDNCRLCDDIVRKRRRLLCLFFRRGGRLREGLPGDLNYFQAGIDQLRVCRLNRLPVLMKSDFVKLVTVSARIALVSAGWLGAAETETLRIALPAPTLKGTPEDLPVGPNIEPLSDKPRPSLQISKGVQNVAAGKPVTSSVKPFTGDLVQLNDGRKEAFDYDSVEMKKGVQWVQVDLGATYAIHAIAMWHDHRYVQIMRDVVVQVSDDPEFKTGVTTAFNNDTDNSAGLGVGTDREYFETHFGRVLDANGVKGRYVRGYTKGSNLSALNCWQELEVYALPADSKGEAAIPSSSNTVVNVTEPLKLQLPSPTPK